MYFTSLLIGISAVYLLIYGVGKNTADAFQQAEYPSSLGGAGANTGTKQESNYQRNTVDGNMITSVMRGATNSEQSVTDDNGEILE